MGPDNSNPLYHTESVPRGKQNNYETAYHDAAMILASLSIHEVARKSGGAVMQRGAGQAISLAFLGDEVLVTHPDISVVYGNRDDVVPLWAKILILHYLVRSSGIPERNEPITFKQLEGGMAYDPAFQRRSIAPLIGSLDGGFERLVQAGMAAGGRPVPVGDLGLAFAVFPRVEVTFALWKGDAEFPPSGNVMFDSSIAEYLSTEDVAVLCNMIAVNIVKAFRSRA